jgi:hypothetical protein
MPATEFDIENRAQLFMHTQVNRFNHLPHWPWKIENKGNSEAQATGKTPLLNRSGTCRVLKLCII